MYVAYAGNSFGYGSLVAGPTTLAEAYRAVSGLEDAMILSDFSTFFLCYGEVERRLPFRAYWSEFLSDKPTRIPLIPC
jgi:hypothetical protein